MISFLAVVIVVYALTGAVTFWTGKKVGAAQERKRRRAVIATTTILCTRCRNDLLTTPGTKCTTNTSSQIVRYECGACGTMSRWDFGAPVPLLMGYLAFAKGPYR